MPVLCTVPGRAESFNPAFIVPPAQIVEDLAQLAKVTDCIRTYSTANGLDRIPEFGARRAA